LKRQQEDYEEAKTNHEKDMEELEEGVERTEFDEEKFLKGFNERETAVEVPEVAIADEDADIAWEEPEL
jgi:hypothetical protein